MNPIALLSNAALHANVRSIATSPTMSIQETCDRLVAEGRRVRRLGLGQSPFPVPAIVVEELRANAARKEYLPVRGLPALRAAVAENHRRRDDLAVRAEDVIIGPGSKELLFLLQVVFDGQLIVPTPAWVSYGPQAHIAGREVHFMATDAESGWRLRAEALARHCEQEGPRHRILVLNYPSNPTGTTYAASELEAIARVARQHGVVILADEIYAELHHDGGHVSVARYYPEGTIVSSGLSKWCGAGGWRLGTFAFPRQLSWLLDAMAAVASETYTTTSAPIQYAAVRAFQGGPDIERYLRQVRRILAALARHATRTLRHGGVAVAEPAGAFYLFVDFGPAREALVERGIQTGAEACRHLLDEAGVAILPGEAFGRGAGELTARLALVDFDGSCALAAAETVPPTDPLDDSFLHKHCHATLDGVYRIAQWARGVTQE